MHNNTFNNTHNHIRNTGHNQMLMHKKQKNTHNNRPDDNKPVIMLNHIHTKEKQERLL